MSSAKTRKIVLNCRLSPGDIVMLTAAVRDLHRGNPGVFETLVNTTAPGLWKHNPLVTFKSEEEPGIESIDCHYPLINQSNQRPFHFIHGYSQYLSETLGVPIVPTAFKGDIYLSDEEKGWISQVEEITGTNDPFWIVVAGGKFDFTIKWWSHERFQQVVDYFQGKIQFVQIGEDGHNHKPLQNVIDLRGKTDIRQLIRLVYHAQGILCPVTFAMHLAAAVPTKPGAPKSRPCVVVAGGREPVHWEAYPGHRFLHTQGALTCCETGGCWKSRTAPLGDGHKNDRRENLCQRVEKNGLPKCMDMISASDVIRSIESYFQGDLLQYLKPEVSSRSGNWPNRNGQLQPSGKSNLLKVYGLRRSGLHAIMNWVLSHFEGEVSFVNDFNHKGKPLDKIPRSDDLPCIDQKNRISTPPNRHSKQRTLLLGYEEASLAEISRQPLPQQFQNSAGVIRRIIILRDPYNLFASRLQLARTKDFGKELMSSEDGSFDMTELWKEYAKEFIGETKVLGDDAIRINYNRWTIDLEYRKTISRELGRPFSDKARESVPAYGSGSSFDGTKYNQNGSNMQVMKRWKAFENDPEYLSFFNDPEIRNLAVQIFGAEITPGFAKGNQLEAIL